MSKSPGKHSGQQDRASFPRASGAPSPRAVWPRSSLFTAGTGAVSRKHREADQPAMCEQDRGRSGKGWPEGLSRPPGLGRSLCPRCPQPAGRRDVQHPGLYKSTDSTGSTHRRPWRSRSHGHGEREGGAGGGEGPCVTGQSPVWEDEHVLGTDGGTAARQCECARRPRTASLKVVTTVNLVLCVSYHN